jgi:hypothetical protein
MDKRTLRTLDSIAKRAANRRKVASPDKLRPRWIEHWASVERKRRKWVRFQMVGPFWPKPLPLYLRGLTCGARTRDGTPCWRVDLSKRNGRCSVHGGVSTGPKTPAGKSRAAANSGLAEYWADIRASMR